MEAWTYLGSLIPEAPEGCQNLIILDINGINKNGIQD